MAKLLTREELDELRNQGALVPQFGFQQNALCSKADIAIIGGSAGGGKTYTLLLEPLRNVTIKDFTAIYFRRNTKQITNPGALWDTSMKMYPLLGATPVRSRLSWIFPSGCHISFAHLEHENTIHEWQGSQIAYIAFDELTLFSESMFFYMLSRNRSMCGIKPYVRASCNPDPDSWVATFIEWWIDQETGFPIKERIGKIRYMVRSGEVVIWGDSRQEVFNMVPDLFANPALVATGVNPLDMIKSVTFIPGSLYENQLLLKQDPGYLGNLLALPVAEQAKLLDGNWKIRLDGLGLFEYPCINAIFEGQVENNPNAKKCITVDAARFGRDLCVMMVWKGWEVIHMVIYKKSDVHDIVNKIEELRRKFGIIRLNVVVDQDGVGGGAVKLGQYRGFHGGHPARKDPNTHKIENYKNFKTQCFYRVSNRVNRGEVFLNISSENVEIYDDSSLAATRSLKIKINGKIWDVRDLIKKDLAAIKRANIDMEGKFQINTKDEQKEILKRSPDFADTIMMRESLEMVPAGQAMRQLN